MDVAQISEIFLNDPNATEDTVPSAVSLGFDRGLNGDRGSYIIPGLGNPNTYDFTNSYILDNEGKKQSIVPNVFDWYLDLSPTSLTYLTMFYLDDETRYWKKIFKMSPNTYNRDLVATFTAGFVMENIVVPVELLALSQLFGDQSIKNDFSIYRIPDIDDNITSVDSESEMLDLLDAEVGDYAYRLDRSQFFRLIVANPALVDSWQEELSINISLDVEKPAPGTFYPTITGFTLDHPIFDGTNYNFPISISAAELQPLPTGVTPVVGPRILHLSISVV